MRSKKPKVDILYSIDLFGRESDNSSDLTLYDIIRNNKYFEVRYYGCCAIKTVKTFEEAKAYIDHNTAHLKESKGL